MTSQIDLNALRNHVHQVQREREQSGASSAEQSRPVTVDREGGVHLGQPGGIEVSQVPIEKFADLFFDNTPADRHSDNSLR